MCKKDTGSEFKIRFLFFPKNYVVRTEIGLLHLRFLVDENHRLSFIHISGICSLQEFCFDVIIGGRPSTKSGRRVDTFDTYQGKEKVEKIAIFEGCMSAVLIVSF